jgi:hypothetical protein
MNSWHWWAILLALTFVSRWWPRLVRPDARDSDTYYHLLQAENIRTHRFRLPRRHPQFALPGEYRYPPVYHYLLALFPKKAREKFEKISSALFDTLLVAVFLWLAVQELRPLGWNTASLFLLGLSFALNPAFVGVGTGPRAYQGTARTLGELMAAVVFACIWRYWSSGSWMWMIIAILSGSFTLNASKFSGQVLLFLSCFLAFLLNSTTLLAFPLLCIVGAVVVSRGHYWRILVNQIGHLGLYATKIIHSHPVTQARKRWIWPNSLTELVKFLLFENVYAVLIMKFAVSLLTLGVLVWNSTFSGLNTVNSFLAAWLVAAFLVFAVTSTRTFLFLGEADRYLQYALIPTFLLFGALLETGYRDGILIGLVGFYMVLYVLYVSILVWQYGRKFLENIPKLIVALDAQEPTVLLSLIEFAPWEFAYRTKHYILFSESLTRIYFSEEEYERLFWRYPLPRPDFKYYVEKYGVGLIAVSKREVEKARKEGCVYDFTGLDKIFENDTHLLYSVPKGYTNDHVELSQTTIMDNE